MSITSFCHLSFFFHFHYGAWWSSVLQHCQLTTFSHCFFLLVTLSRWNFLTWQWLCVSCNNVIYQMQLIFQSSWQLSFVLLAKRNEDVDNAFMMLQCLSRFTIHFQNSIVEFPFSILLLIDFLLLIFTWSSWIL